MAWTYGGNPGSNNKDQVRFLVQDTDQNDQLLQDEEINFLLNLEGSPLKAAAKAAETIAAKFARFCDESVGKVRVSFSQKSEQYFELAKNLKRSSTIKEAIPFSGALTESQKDTQEEDNDRVQPFFTRGRHDFLRQPNEDEGRAITEGVQEEDEI